MWQCQDIRATGEQIFHACGDLAFVHLSRWKTVSEMFCAGTWQNRVKKTEMDTKRRFNIIDNVESAHRRAFCYRSFASASLQGKAEAFRSACAARRRKSCGYLRLQGDP